MSFSCVNIFFSRVLEWSSLNDRCGNSYVAGDIRVAGRAEGSTPLSKRSLCDTRKERPILLGVNERLRGVAESGRDGTGDKRPINISRLNLRDKKINRFLEPSLPPCFLMSTLFGAGSASIEFWEQVGEGGEKRV